MKYKTIAALTMLAAMGYGTIHILKKSDEDTILKKIEFVERNKGIEILDELKRSDLKEEVLDEIIDVCYEKKSEMNKQTEIRKGFHNPYQLRYAIKKIDGKASGYLIDIESGITYPIYEDIQVGSVEHRINGLKRIAEKKIYESFEEAKRAVDDALDYIAREVLDK